MLGRSLRSGKARKQRHWGAEIRSSPRADVVAWEAWLDVACCLEDSHDNEWDEGMRGSDGDTAEGGEIIRAAHSSRERGVGKFPCL